MGFTIKDKLKKEKEKSIYNVNELTELGYTYDECSAYVPYPIEENPTHYLGISRTESKKSEIIYSWVKKNDDGFAILTVHKSDKLVSEEDSKLTEKLSIAAKNAGLKTVPCKVISNKMMNLEIQHLNFYRREHAIKEI